MSDARHCSDIADFDSVIPLIDGGTEGFKGHCRVIVPRLTSCFECSLELFPPQTNYPMCTLGTQRCVRSRCARTRPHAHDQRAPANTPRLPAHCVEYALKVLWPRDRASDKLDKDNAEHMLWIFEQAKKRADEFGISGVTLKKTQGVVKNIIPAIASTNAAIAAAEVNEALKYVTSCAGNLENYLMYNGVTGLYTHTFEYEKNPQCAVCGKPQTRMTMPRSGARCSGADAPSDPRTDVTRAQRRSPTCSST